MELYRNLNSGSNQSIKDLIVNNIFKANKRAKMNDFEDLIDRQETTDKKKKISKHVYLNDLLLII